MRSERHSNLSGMCPVCAPNVSVERIASGGSNSSNSNDSSNSTSVRAPSQHLDHNNSTYRAPRFFIIV